MSSKFFESFLVAGVGAELRPEGMKKNLLCGIKDIMIVEGDVSALRQRLTDAGEENSLRWTRFLALSEELKVYVAIRYSNPFKAEDALALYDVELVRSNPDVPPAQVKATKGAIVQTVEATSVNTFADIFG